MSKNERSLFKLDYPLSGFLKDVILHGLSPLFKSPYNIFTLRGDDVYLSEDIDLDEIDDEISRLFEEESRELYKKMIDAEMVRDGRFKDSRMGRNDSKNLKLIFKEWFSKEYQPTTYLNGAFDIIGEVKDGLQNGTISFLDSINSQSLNKKGFYLGVNFNDTWGIAPAVLKNIEYYEYRHGFGRPTKGKVYARFYLDPIWYSIFSIGLLSIFAGFYGGSYYFIYKEGLDAYFGNPSELERLLKFHSIVTTANMRNMYPYDVEEIYELVLSHDIAEYYSKERPSERPLYTLKVLTVSIIGNAWTAQKYNDLDLSELLSYFTRYIDLWKSSRESTRLADRWPFKEILNVAKKEMMRVVKGDNGYEVLECLKDVHRAIASRSREFYNTVLYRLMRKGVEILDVRDRTPDAVDNDLYWSMRHFLAKFHVSALLEAWEEWI